MWQLLKEIVAKKWYRIMYATLNSEDIIFNINKKINKNIISLNIYISRNI